MEGKATKEWRFDRTILTFDNGFRAYIVSQFWKNGNQATREGILNCVKYPLDFRVKPIQDILRGEKVISKDEILSSPIVLFKKNKNYRFCSDKSAT